MANLSIRRKKTHPQSVVSYKDEDKRFGLHSFTARGGPDAYERVVGRPWEEIRR